MTHPIRSAAVPFLSALAVAASLALAGCEATGNGDFTGSIATHGRSDVPFAALSGREDNLEIARQHFEAENYGLAEKHFRLAVEKDPKNAEGWLGLAAAYDELGRFDLADRAYEQAIAIAGERPEILNNRGYSYLLRGDYKTARKDLMAAAALDPDNPNIKANLELLAKATGKTG